MNRLFPWSPTWGEINFKAYKLATVEFHNELYGRLQENNAKFNERDFEAWLVTQGLTQSKTWIKEQRGIAQPPYNVSLQTFIRNKIHHPENTSMQAHQYTNAELAQSINEMISLL